MDCGVIMRHSLKAEGFGVRLRPVRIDDAAFIVWLRHLDYVKGKLGDSAPDVASQEAWLNTYFEREGDYYFIVETAGGIPVGTHGIYGVTGTRAESGRFIIRQEVPAAVPTSVLSFELVFEKMGIRELWATSVASNRSLHSYIRKLGCRQVRTETAGRIIDGKPVDLLHFVQTAEDWFKVREGAVAMARFAEIQIRDWDQAQLRKRDLR
jgi:RimJ/RimL family protein N-acetyltransferase